MGEKQFYQEIDIEIDGLTNSIEHVASGVSYRTEVLPIDSVDYKNILRRLGWSFDWRAEGRKPGRSVYKLIVRDSSFPIQGLVSMSDFGDHYYVHLVETHPANRSKPPVFRGVGGNLFAFACKMAWDKGYDGSVAFYSKTRLLDHYIHTLRAVHLGNQRMVILPDSALYLIRRYFKDEI